MPIAAKDWVSPDVHAWTFHPSSDADWDRLIDDYGGSDAGPLRQIMDVVRANRTRTVVVENRYVDLDYRSEFSAFWSKRFEVPPPFARRLHFFRSRIDDGDLGRLSAAARRSYVGYSVVKPISWGPVGRTVLRPPPRLRSAVLTQVSDEISLFGDRLEVTGVPFIQQDTEYLVCAHAAVWLCHYVAYRRGHVGRRTTAALADSTPEFLSDRRSVPSEGLNLNQIQAIFSASDQPAIFYSIDCLPDIPGVATPMPQTDPSSKKAKHPGYWDTRLFSIICRYLNSGFPVLVGGQEHAVVVVGWLREGGETRFVVCDDRRGPYEVVDPFVHNRTPWQVLMVPMPPKVYRSAEVAEQRARKALQTAGVRVPLQEWVALRDRLQAGELVLRTTLLSNLDYKEAITKQGRPREAVRALRLARLPHYLWVVEAHNRAALERGTDPTVEAEVLWDPTAEDKLNRPEAFSVPLLTSIIPPDGGTTVEVQVANRRWRSLIPQLVGQYAG